MFMTSDGATGWFSVSALAYPSSPHLPNPHHLKELKHGWGEGMGRKGIQL